MIDARKAFNLQKVPYGLDNDRLWFEIEATEIEYRIRVEALTGRRCMVESLSNGMVKFLEKNGYGVYDLSDEVGEGFYEIHWDFDSEGNKYD